MGASPPSSAALDWLLQIGFDHDGRRRVFSLVEVNEDLAGGDVTFNPLVQYAGNGIWNGVGEKRRVRGFMRQDLPPDWRGLLALDTALRERFAPVIERRRAAFRIS